MPRGDFLRAGPGDRGTRTAKPASIAAAKAATKAEEERQRADDLKAKHRIEAERRKHVLELRYWARWARTSEMQSALVAASVFIERKV